MNTSFSFFYQIPIAMGGALILVLFLLALQAGYRVGFKQRKEWKNADLGGGTVALSSMFALLGLILAFTYASGVNRNDARKAAVLVEANVLGTAFLRADLIAEPGRSDIKEKLLAYAKTRITESNRIFTDEERLALLANSIESQSTLWPALMKAIGQVENPGPMEASLVSAMNDVLDEHAKRINTVLDKIPQFVLLTLVFIAIATLAVTGYNAGLSGRISLWRTTALSMALTGVMMMIMDFDRPSDGFIIVNQYPLEAAIESMEADLLRTR